MKSASTSTSVAPYQPSEHFSPSSLTLAAECERAWGYRYLEGRKDPEVDWALVEAGAQVTSGQRSKALGKAVHAVLQGYFEGQLVDWSTTPARAALPGLALLPHPSEVEQFWIERPITIDSRLWRPGVSVRFKGYEDLVVMTNDYRLVLTDFKTTRDFKWQKSEADLCRELQSIAYYADVTAEWGRRPDIARWLYLLTPTPANIHKWVPKARFTDFCPSAQEINSVMGAAIDRAVDLREKMRAFEKKRLRVIDLTPNAAHCEAYGGCRHHQSRGGPCDGGYTPEQIVQYYQETKVSDENQALTEFQRRCQTLGQAVAPAPAPAQPTPPPPEPTPPKRGRGRPAGSKNKSKNKSETGAIETTGVTVSEETVPQPPANEPPQQMPPMVEQEQAEAKTVVVADKPIQFNAELQVTLHGIGFIQIRLPEEFDGYIKAMIFGVTGRTSERSA